MCDSGGEPITYEQMMPPEALDFRNLLYDYVGGQNNLFQQGAPQYPGQLPFTGPPGQGQMAGMNTILAMMGYGPYQAPGMPSSPPQNIYPDIYNPGRRDKDKDRDRRDDENDYRRNPDDNPPDPDDPYAPRRRRGPRDRDRDRGRQ